MDPASINVKMFVFPQRAKSGDAAAARLSIDEALSIPIDMPAPEKKHNRSLSWLTSHRRKDSGVSVSTKSSKGLRISSPRPVLATTRSDRSSIGSGLSRESNRLSVDSTRILSALANDPPTWAVPESPVGLRSPAFPPKRPERPQEGLFDDLIETEGDDSMEYSSLFGITCEEDGGEHEHQHAAGEENARTSGNRVRRRSRELLGLAMEAVGAALPDVRSRSSCASPRPGSSAAFSIASSQGHRRQHHQKAFSESLAVTFLERKPSIRAPCSPTPESSTQNPTPAPMDAHAHRSRSSRWTLTESMADMFKSPRSPRSPKSPRSRGTQRLPLILDRKKEDKEHKIHKVVQKLVTEYPVIGDFLGHQPDIEEGPTSSEPFRRPDGLPVAYHGSLGARQRAVPFEIAIPPPPRSELYSHCRGGAELESPTFRPQQRQSREPDETKAAAAADGDEATAEGRSLGHLHENAAEEARDVQNGEALKFPDVPNSCLSNPARSPTMPQLSSTPDSYRLRGPRNKFLELETRLIPPSAPHQRSRSLSQLGVETEERVYLKSTPFTLTNPAFRHGPITLQKSEMKAGSVIMESPVMDLAAFQSAIGGVGHLQEVAVEEDETHGGSDDDDDESHIADEMTAWFEEFGFETHGELIAAEKPAERNQDRTSWDSACSMGSTLSVPLMIKTAASTSPQCSGGEKQQQQNPVVVPGSQRQRQRVLETIKQLGENAADVAAPSFYDFTVDYSKY